jgi:hypothetical protein
MGTAAHRNGCGHGKTPSQTSGGYKEKKGHKEEGDSIHYACLKIQNDDLPAFNFLAS